MITNFVHMKSKLNLVSNEDSAFTFKSQAKILNELEQIRSKIKKNI